MSLMEVDYYKELYYKHPYGFIEKTFNLYLDCFKDDMDDWVSENIGRFGTDERNNIISDLDSFKEIFNELCLENKNIHISDIKKELMKLSDDREEFVSYIQHIFRRIGHSSQHSEYPF